MSSENVRSLHASVPALTLAAASDVLVGRIVDVQDGQPYVAFGDCTRVRARVALGGMRETPAAMLDGQPVLLLLENGDSALPIVVGLVGDTLPGLGAEAGAAADVADGFVLNGKRISFEGRESVELRCGQASIMLRADGQVIVKGTRLMSRASESNKIRGAAVLIN